MEKVKSGNGGEIIDIWNPVGLKSHGGNIYGVFGSDPLSNVTIRKFTV